MAEFDVGLIPFKQNALTAAVDPIKYYEYRALALPVISTDFGEMHERGDLPGLSATRRLILLRWLRPLCSVNAIPMKPVPLHGNTHGRRVLMPPSFIHNCDVIVVNYNAGKLIGDCVASALKEGALRVIVVDNGSSDGSLAHLKAYEADARVSIIRNNHNSGFAAACNTGAGVCDAGTLLFLNPDCVLMPGALGHMMDVLHSDPATGMVGGFLSNPRRVPNSRADDGCSPRQGVRS